MKRVITFVIAVFVTVVATAQGHLKFNKVPINGTMEEMANKLAESGLTGWDFYEAAATTTGDIPGLGECKITIYGSSKTKTSYSVLVETRDHPDVWDYWYNKYVELKASFKDDAIKPVQFVEKYQTDCEPWQQLKVAQAYKEGLVAADASFVLEQGTIHLEVVVDRFNSISLHITYEDDINNSKKEAEK